jgi:hypothetical protein
MPSNKTESHSRYVQTRFNSVQSKYETHMTQMLSLQDINAKLGENFIRKSDEVHRLNRFFFQPKKIPVELFYGLVSKRFLDCRKIFRREPFIRFFGSFFNFTQNIRNQKSEKYTF